MSPVHWLIALAVVAYFLGSVPFGLLVGLAKGVDVRTAGSGNIGATNVGRLLGGKFFALVFVLDMLKSLLPLAIGSAVVHGALRDAPQAVPHDWRLYLLWLAVGFAALIGHMFSIFLKFKGGKGVATGAGVLLGLFPYFTIPALAAIGTFIVVFFAWRYVSLGSIVGASLFPVYYVLVGLWRGWPVFDAQLPLLIFSSLMAGLIVYKHRTNIARLRAGTENKFARKTVAAGR